MDQKRQIEINGMILELLDGTISSERFTVLERWLGSDDEAIEYYTDFMKNYSSLRQGSACGSQSTESMQDSDSLADSAVWQALAEEERSAESIEVEVEEDTNENQSLLLSAEQANAFKVRHQVSKLTLAIAVLSSAAMLFLVLLAWLTPEKPPIVASLSKAVNASLVNADGEVNIADDMRAERFELSDGFAEILFYNDAVVLVQAPAVFELESGSQMKLISGRLTSNVPPTAVGFTVRTPGGSVVDYGTEFGVSVGGDGKTDVEVFKGQVDLRKGSDPRVFEKAVRLVAGRAGQLSGNGVLTSRDVTGQSVSYVREIPKSSRFSKPGRRLSLADMVGGGNGFGTGKIDHVINLDTGMVSERRFDGVNNWPTPGKCIEVSGLPFVDCLFVPDGGEGVDQVRLSGVKFEQCPDTNGYSHGDISNGGKVLHQPGRIAEIVLDGTRYGTVDKPAIYIHGNQGITFDLEAIRESMPGVSISKFTSLCGISDTVTVDSTYQRGFEPNTSFRVLVDGKTRFVKEGVKLFDMASRISIELTDLDKYLSLVVTDGDNIHGFDWGVFALAALELSVDSNSLGNVYKDAK